MRYSKEHKQETHARIVKKAATRLRERGAHGIGVADLMKDAGLTHGGFYAHFDSREALVIEAFSYAMDRAIERWRKVAADIPPEKRLSTIIDGYLSAAHRDDPGQGCAIPALGAEIARESPKTRKAFALKLDQMIDMIADQIPDIPRKAARKQAMAVLATMMGTIVMSRISGSGEMSDEILAAGREAVMGRAAAVKAPAKKRVN
ncbi:MULTISPECIES: TetR/AcrR family transcriptional regulator [unclassified Bradyrhizobium]|uniref:TetR/AcrR family transcriptional regulator n=1 Tax=unclassified Bradyrhizobium TaxID=2631580 RepID=UPI000424B655|nr:MULTISPECIES: TetR/AcrR family transcriptional regulator [unclassified Bradyrhizobium]QIG91405.1 TetR/AcrR family transcriptional regulator [Bradyrhizobium sp. 6(2017)]